MALRERELGKIGPILSDGTPVGDLIDVERREASLRLFHDPEIWELEQQQLFAKSWIILGHETEIPEPGDYVMRQLAADPVIVTRDREGAIQVLLNVCTHRGMQVCRSECGSTTSFKCSYHGWVFGNDGNLLGAPFEKEMYGDAWSKGEMGLRRARVDSYAGIIFANWSWDAPPLDEFLGDYAWYLDTIFKRTKGGLEMLGAPQRFVIKSNWKAAAEQFNGADGYHAFTLHRSMFDVAAKLAGIDVLDMARNQLDAVDVGSRLGHGVRCMNIPYRAVRFFPERSRDELDALDPIELLTRVTPESMPPELVPELLETMTEGQMRTLVTYAPGPGGIFPNGAFLSTQLRTYMPISVNRFQLVNFPLVEKDSTPEFKRLAIKKMLAGFGTSGTIEQDDAEAWPSIQTSAGGFMGRQERMRYRGFCDGSPPEEGWGAGGNAETYTGFSKDDCSWNWWLRYRDYMTETAW